MSDADLLRRAADRVRYLAGDPAEWDMDTHNLTTFEVHEQDERGWWSRLIGRSFRPTRALHVAAWNPKTAHLVADWLESEIGLWGPDADDVDDHAHRIARALLNEPKKT